VAAACKLAVIIYALLCETSHFQPKQLTRISMIAQVSYGRRSHEFWAHHDMEVEANRTGSARLMLTLALRYKDLRRNVAKLCPFIQISARNSRKINCV